MYPVLLDLDQLERKANRLLEGRRRAGGVYKPDANGLVKPFGIDLPFFSLYFAVLASGCQLSDIPEKDRELTSWIYGMSSSAGSKRHADSSPSLLRIPVSADVELCLATHRRGHPDPSHH